MKKVFLITTLCILQSVICDRQSAIAQSPQSFNYQGVARDTSGNTLALQNIGIKISILTDSVGGPVAYSETHNPTTDDFGVFDLAIGGGTVFFGVFSTIDWGGSSHFAKIEMDETGGATYTVMGTMQLLSVPYALYAGYADSAYFSDESDTANYAYDAGYADTADFAWNAVWDQNGDTIYYNDGNVGIGTTSPAVELHIYKDANTYTLNMIENSSNTDSAFAGVLVKSATSEGYFGVTPANYNIMGTHTADRVSVTAWLGAGGLDLAAFDFSGDLRFYTGGGAISNERMRIDAAGNVGIGTTSPAGKLDVEGKIKEYGNDLLPSGVIVMWSGTLGAIPAGWALCDGNIYTAPDGGNVTTVDLTEKFIYGVAAGENPGATGGNTTHTHTYIDLPSHTHSITELSHFHTYNYPNSCVTVASGAGESVRACGAVSDSTSSSITGITINLAGIALPETDATLHLPPYYKLAYIMKL